MRLLYSLILVPFLSYSQFYVTDDGAGKMDGTSEANAWTLSQALKAVPSNATIYIKAGDYSDDYTGSPFFIGKNGVKLIGYTSAPGDIATGAGAGPSRTKEQGLSPSVMPYFDIGNPSGTTAFIISADDVLIENIQITHADYGLQVYAGSDRLTVRNVYLWELGADGCPNVSSCQPYTGRGIQLNGPDALIENCSFRNIGAEMMLIVENADNTRVQYCVFYSEDINQMTDYMLLVASSKGPTNKLTGVIIDNNRFERAKGLSHGSRAVDLKFYVEDCEITNNYIKGTQIQLSYPQCQNNLIAYNHLEGYGTEASEWHTTIQMYNNPGVNKIFSNVIENSWQGITAISNGDDNQNMGNTTDGGGSPKVYNNLIVNVDRAFYLNAQKEGVENPDLGAPARNWDIRNNYINARWLFLSNMAVRDLKFYGNILSGVELGFGTFTNSGNNFKGSFGDSDIQNNYSYKGHTETGITTITDPLFVNETHPPLGMQLQANSPLIDLGTGKGISTDYHGASAKSTRDIGPFEHNGIRSGDEGGNDGNP